MYTFKTKGSCAQHIEIDVQGDVIRSVRFIGGCAGNAQGISALLPGMNVDDAIDKLKGIQCRNGTSCPDQLAKALIELKGDEGKIAQKSG